MSLEAEICHKAEHANLLPQVTEKVILLAFFFLLNIKDLKFYLAQYYEAYLPIVYHPVRAHARWC